MAACPTISILSKKKHTGRVGIDQLILEKSSNLIKHNHRYLPSIPRLECRSDRIQTLIQIRIKAETGRHD